MTIEEKMSALEQGLFVLFSIVWIMFFWLLFFPDFDPTQPTPPKTAAWARADAETIALAWAKAHYDFETGYSVVCHDDGAHPISKCIVYVNAQGHKSEIMLDCLVGAMAPHGCRAIKTE